MSDIQPPAPLPPAPAGARTLRRRRRRGRLRNALEAAGVKLIAGLCRLLGLDAASAVSGAVWRTLGPFNRRHRRALANLARAFPETSAAERERIARAAWENLGRTMAEGFLLDRLLASPERFDDRAVAVFAAAKAEGRGLVAVSAHYGNWELGATSVVAAGFRPMGVYRAVDNPHVDALVRQVREPLYPGGLVPKGPGAPRRLIGHARAGEAVVIMADLRDGNGVEVPFFGVPSPSSPFPALIARLLDAPLIAGRVVRTKGARFEMLCERIDVPRTGDRDADVLATTAAVAALFERWIRERPEQWMWSMGRWR